MLIAYVEKIRGVAAENFRHAQLLYQIRVVFGGDEKPPEPPPLLREAKKR